MATEVKRYLASDGKEFQTARDADNHDLIVEISEQFGIFTDGKSNLRISLTDMLNAGYKIIPPPKATHDPRG